MPREVIRFIKQMIRGCFFFLLGKGIKIPIGLFGFAKQKLQGDTIAIYRNFSKYTLENQRKLFWLKKNSDMRINEPQMLTSALKRDLCPWEEGVLVG